MANSIPEKMKRIIPQFDIIDGRYQKNGNDDFAITPFISYGSAYDKDLGVGHAFAFNWGYWAIYIGWVYLNKNLKK